LVESKSGLCRGNLFLGNEYFIEWHISPFLPWPSLAYSFVSVNKILTSELPEALKLFNPFIRVKPAHDFESPVIDKGNHRPTRQPRLSRSRVMKNAGCNCAVSSELGW